MPVPHFILLAEQISPVRVAFMIHNTSFAARNLGSGTPGVGIRGMRERLHQLGGSLEIQSNGSGTQIEARVPVAVTAGVAA